MRAVTLYRLSGLAVLIGMPIVGIASILYSRAGGVALYLDPLVPADDLAKLLGSLIFLIGLPGLYAFQAAGARRLGLVGFVFSFFGLAVLEVGTEALFAFTGPVLAAHHQTRFLLLGGMDQNLGGGFAAYFALSYAATVIGFLSFGIATFRARVYPRWAGFVIATGTVAAIVMAPLASVPSGPFRLDRIGVLAAAIAFAWCGWHLLRHAASPRSGPEGNGQVPTVSAVARTGSARRADSSGDSKPAGRPGGREQARAVRKAGQATVTAPGGALSLRGRHQAEGKDHAGLRHGSDWGTGTAPRSRPSRGGS